jgi:hypothetical protein
MLERIVMDDQTDESDVVNGGRQSNECMAAQSPIGRDGSPDPRRYAVGSVGMDPGCRRARGT